MEQRVMLAAAPTAAVVSFPTVTNPATNTEQLVISYTDTSNPVAFASLNVNNITVTTPANTPLTVTALTSSPATNGPTLSVTYTVQAPGGALWDNSENGTYNVALNNTVTDTATPADAVTPNANFGTFTVNVPPDAPPTAALGAHPNVTSAGQANTTVVVTYTDIGDNFPVLPSSIGNNNITISGGTAALTVTGTSATSINNDHTEVVTYTITPPGGSGFVNTQNGTYTISLNPVVTDTGLRAVAGNAALGTFAVNVGQLPANPNAPSAAIVSAPAVTTPASKTEEIVVRYTDNQNPIALASLNVNNITVTAPNNTVLGISAVTTTSTTNSGTISATYTVQAPGATFWNSAENGTYRISLNNTVTDTQTPPNTTIPNATFGTFTVNVGFDAAPVAVLTSAPVVTQSGSLHELITITYTDANDNFPVDPATVLTTNITVGGGPAGALTVSAVSSSSNNNNHTIIATYTVDSPTTDGFVNTQNGTYTIAMTGTLTDTANHPVAANPTFSSFAVNVGDAGPVARLTSAPTVVSPVDIFGLPASELLVVTYSDIDSTIIKASTLDKTNIDVHAPNGQALTITGATVGSAVNAPNIVVTYTVAPPNGVRFQFTDVGTYVVSETGTATDVAGVPTTSGQIGTFTVAIPNPNAPVAQLTSAPTITNPNTNRANIVITYIDRAIPVDPNTLGTNNISVTGPNGENLSIVGMSDVLVNANTTAIVTYTVQALNNLNFAAAENGTYTIGLAGNVTNTAGDPVVANPTFGTFGIAIGIGNHPPVVRVDPISQINNDGQPNVEIHVTYEDDDAAPIKGSTITTAGITVVGPGGTALTVSGVSVSDAGNVSFINATYTVQAPGNLPFNASDNGLYTVRVTNTVTDTAGAKVAANNNAGLFQVAIGDTTSPTATVTSSNVVLTGELIHKIVVTYTDNVDIYLASIGTTNITVTAPDGTDVPVIGDTITRTGAPNTVIVTYTVEAPNGQSFVSSDNGTYSIALLGSPDGVTDTALNPIAPNANFGSFVVSVTDLTPPTGFIGAPDVTVNGQKQEIVRVVITDDVAVKTSSIKLNSLTVTDPHGAALTVSGFHTNTQVNQKTVTATYTVTAPHAGFNANDNGTYSLSIAGITDVSGNPVAATTTTGTFKVNITAPVADTVPLGSFGAIGKKNVKLKFRDTPKGTIATLTLKGGTGTAYREGNGDIDLVINDAGAGASMTIATSNGAPITLHNVVVNGTLKLFTAKSANVTGTFFVNGTVANASIRQLVGTFVASGPILKFAVGQSITDALLISGANLGADGFLGGGDDTFGAGFIGNLTVGRFISSSILGVGVAPGADGIYGTSDDIKAGTVVSRIDKLTVGRTIDSHSKFLAGAFGKFKAGSKSFVPNPATSNGQYVLFS